ncbi:hypothetical protein ACET3Z_022575 [Daucus carota]
MEPYNESECSMLGVDQSSSIDINVFPPINHEGLHASSLHSHQDELSPESQTLLKLPSSLPSVAELPSSQLDLTQLRNLGSKFLHQYATRIHTWLRNYSVPSGGTGIISFFFGPSTALATMLLMLWYWRHQKQRRILEEKSQLIKIVRERDEEIGKLMRQIALMKKVLYSDGALSPRTK